MYRDKETVSATDDVKCVAQGEGFQTVMPGSISQPTDKVKTRLLKKIYDREHIKPLFPFGNILIFGKS